MNIFANFNDSESILRALALVRKVQKKNPSCTHVGIRHDPAIELQVAPKGHKDNPAVEMLPNCCCSSCAHRHTGPIGEGYQCPKCGAGLWNEPISLE